MFNHFYIHFFDKNKRKWSNSVRISNNFCPATTCGSKNLRAAAMTSCPVFVDAHRPWPDWPCDSSDDDAKIEKGKHNMSISVPISPASRLYETWLLEGQVFFWGCYSRLLFRNKWNWPFSTKERSFSDEVKQCSVSSHVVLQCGGQVMGNGDDQQKHEIYSQELDGRKWDFFISHNWAVKRWKKFLALCLVWSGGTALICCTSVQILCFGLVSMGILPVTNSIIDGHEISVWCIGGCLVTYVAVFLARHELMKLVGHPGYRIFLDKVCVDQSDEGRKREGIQGITAFLYHSEALVVLYSELRGGELPQWWSCLFTQTFLLHPVLYSKSCHWWDTKFVFNMGL